MPWVVIEFNSSHLGRGDAPPCQRGKKYSFTNTRLEPAVAGATLSIASADAVRHYWWLLLVGVAGLVMLVPPVFNRVTTLKDSWGK